MDFIPTMRDIIHNTVRSWILREEWEEVENVENKGKFPPHYNFSLVMRCWSFRFPNTFPLVSFSHFLDVLTQKNDFSCFLFNSSFYRFFFLQQRIYFCLMCFSVFCAVWQQKCAEEIFITKKFKNHKKNCWRYQGRKKSVIEINNLILNVKGTDTKPSMKS